MKLKIFHHLLCLEEYDFVMIINRIHNKYSSVGVCGKGNYKTLSTTNYFFVNQQLYVVSFVIGSQNIMTKFIQLQKEFITIMHFDSNISIYFLSKIKKNICAK